MTYIKQSDKYDCGAACLTMIASHFGSHLSITKIREVAGTDREGTSLKGMLEASKKLNLDAKAEKVMNRFFHQNFLFLLLLIYSTRMVAIILLLYQKSMKNM